MLSLESRYLETLLPAVSGLNVVDLGCGTGRWLAVLSQQTPRHLIGVDSCPEMLGQAARKLNGAATLVLANCNELPLPRASADLVLCSFLTSYIPDLAKFAGQVRRILRPGGAVFVSDLHPTTSARLSWRRGFHVAGSFVDVAISSWSVREIIGAFEKYGIHAKAVLEPEFGDPEREIFARAGRTEAFRLAARQPAIYILHLSLRRSPGKSGKQWYRGRTLGSLCGARVALGPSETVRTDVRVTDGRIDSIGCSSHALRGAARRGVDLSGYLLLPGLINAHDHLDFALFPRLGNGGYRNFIEWAADIHRPDESPVREHRAVPKQTRLWWGGIRNLLAGVTTVCHHNPYEAQVFDNGFAVRVLRDFDWAHSLQMDPSAAEASPTDSRANRPFILHLAEGVDPECAEEIFHLARGRGIDDRTVLVHGLGLDARGLELLNGARASLIWCPSSNIFLFGRTHDRQTIQSLHNVAIGSDSPLTAQGDLLDEVRFAHDVVGMPVEDLYSLVTTRSAQLLRLRDAEGAIRVGSAADFVAVRDTGATPARTLVSLSHRDIELVVIAGSVQLASVPMLARLPRFAATGLRSLSVGGEIRWIRAPLRRLLAETHAHLSGDIRLGGKRVEHGLPA
jgi:cytosine/adenosine deaminase-related metal-dependent hydrolase/SAM-dependent methyltransferase